LQRFAIRILSQTCSASGCERNWSVFERIHTHKRNRLEQKRLNDLVFVQYNLRLRRNQLLNKRPDSDPIVLEDIDPTSDWVVESCPPEFDIDGESPLDFDLEMEAAMLNVDPLVADPVPSHPVAGAGTSSSQPRQRRITRLSDSQCGKGKGIDPVEDVDLEEEAEREFSSSSLEFEAEDIGLSQSND